MPKKHKIIPYNSDLKDLASQLRKNMTLSEILLWNELKQKKMLGYDFDRQRPIDKYIVDFYCKELKLAIEIDGDTHIFRYDYDEERQRDLEKLGVSFLRFEDIEVKKSMSNVLRVIEDWIGRKKPTPRPSKEGSLGALPSEEGSLGVVTSDEGSGKPTTPNPPPKRGRLSKEGSKNQPTPNPSREGSFKALPSEEGSRKPNPPTPRPSREGSLVA